jgi:hypothetical protein
LAFDQLNALLAIVATMGAIICPFVLRWLNKKDSHEESTSEDVEQRLDKYEERLRLAEIAIARNERNHQNGR